MKISRLNQICLGLYAGLSLASCGFVTSELNGTPRPPTSEGPPSTNLPTALLSAVDPIVPAGAKVQFSYSIGPGKSATGEPVEVDSVKLEFSNNGTTYKEVKILDSELNSSTVTDQWQLPATATSSTKARLRIRVTDSLGQVETAESPAFAVISKIENFAGAEWLRGGAGGTAATALIYDARDFVKVGPFIYIATPTAIIKVDTSEVSLPVTLLAGHRFLSGTAVGDGLEARFKGLWGLASDGQFLYASDSTSHAIYQIDPVNGNVALFAGIPGSSGALLNHNDPLQAKFNQPRGLAVLESDLYVADSASNVIRKVSLSSGIVTTFAGSSAAGFVDAAGSSARFREPYSVDVDASDSTNPRLYVADKGNHAIRVITVATQAVSTLAGAGSPGYTDSSGSSAFFYEPSDIAVGESAVYVSDSMNRLIRQINKTTGAVTTLAGTFSVSGDTDGVGLAAKFNRLTAILLAEGMLYASDVFAIRKMDTSSSEVTTWIGRSNLYDARYEPLSHARFSNSLPMLTTDGTSIFIADESNHRVRKLNLSTATVSTYTGSSNGYANGSVANAKFKSVQSAYFHNGTMYVADDNHTIRKIDSSGNVTLVVGSPGAAGNVNNGANSSFNSPRQIVGSGSVFYVADHLNNCIRKIDLNDPENPVVSTVVGTATAGNVNGDFSVARLNKPYGLALVGSKLFVSEVGTHTIRLVDLASSTVSTFAGSGIRGMMDDIGTSAKFNTPRQLEVDASSQFLYVADYGNNRIRKIEIATGEVTTVVAPSGFGFGLRVGARGPSGLVRIGGILYFTNNRGFVQKFSLDSGYVSVAAGYAHSEYGRSDGVAVRSTPEIKSIVRVADQYFGVSGGTTSTHAVYRINSSGTAELFVGVPNEFGWRDGAGNQALFSTPADICAIGESLYVSDSWGSTIRKIDINTKVVSTVAGQPGQRGNLDGDATTVALITAVNSLVCDETRLYFTSGETIRMLDFLTNKVVTLAGVAGVTGDQDGAGLVATFSRPKRLAKAGKFLFVNDDVNHTVRKIDISDLSSPVVSTFAGTTGEAGYADGPGNQAKFNTPDGLSTDGTFLYVGDSENHLIRRIRISTGEVSTLVGSHGSYGTRNGQLSSALVHYPWAVMVIGSEIFISDDVLVRRIR